jgi:hypothetical protein
VTPDERAQARQAELEMVLIREAVSLIVVAGVLLLCSPAVKIWCRQQAWRFRQYRGRAAESEEAMVAELRRDLSRIEHGGMT